jgi:tyrosinase
MTSLAWSSFDPIFMLHHANVDRLIAMWQAAHPDSPMFTGTQRTSSSMFGTPSGTSYTASSGLKPFYTSSGSSLWTSTGTTSTRAFGYTYPELQDWTMSSSDLQTYVIQQVNKLYGTSATVSKRSLRTRQDDTVTQYMAEISVDRKDLQLPSSINMYLGDTLAGTFTLLAMPTTGLSYGNIPLQDPLANFKANIAESAQDTVVRLLKTSLRVEMVTPDGATKSILNVPSLKVNLEVSTVQPPASASEFPKYLSTQKIQVALNDLVSN